WCPGCRPQRNKLGSVVPGLRGTGESGGARHGGGSDGRWPDQSLGSQRHHRVPTQWTGGE
ncbi:MAG: hypothetical protein ACK56I_30335, partial [bacterium]